MACLVCQFDESSICVTEYDHGEHICMFSMHRLLKCLPVWKDGDGRYAHTVTCGDNTTCDFAAISNEHLCDDSHYRGWNVGCERRFIGFYMFSVGLGNTREQLDFERPQCSACPVYGHPLGAPIWGSENPSCSYSITVKPALPSTTIVLCPTSFLGISAILMFSHIQ